MNKVLPRNYFTLVDSDTVEWEVDLLPNIIYQIRSLWANYYGSSPIAATAEQHWLCVMNIFIIHAHSQKRLANAFMIHQSKTEQNLASSSIRQLAACHPFFKCSIAHIDQHHTNSECVSLGTTRPSRQREELGATESREHVSDDCGRMKRSLAHIEFTAGILITPAHSLCFKYNSKSWNCKTNFDI